MSNANLLRWVEALESGDYAQTTAVLKYDPISKQNDILPVGHCCLGVACELAEDEIDLEAVRYVRDMGGMYIACPDGPIVDWLASEDAGYSGGWGPREALARWLGIDEGHLTEFARMNDSGRSFKQIARVIRERFGLGPRQPECGPADSSSRRP